LDKFQFHLTIDYANVDPQCKRDQLLLDIILATNPPEEVLILLTRCQIAHNKALYLSDGATEQGKQLGSSFLYPPRAGHEAISSFDFPIERPGPQDWANWLEFWQS
jgi:hypothetical protein